MTSRATKSNANGPSEVARAFAKTLNLGLLYADKKGVIKFINKKFERIFALAPKIFYGAKFDEMIAAAQGLDELKSFKNLKNSPLNSSDFIVKKGEKSFRLNVSNVLEGGVKFDGFILAVTDITHEKELEKKELEHRRSVLAHAKTALVGEMINSISHQQRQPLSALGLYLDNIEECAREGEFERIPAQIAACKKSLRLMDETIKAFRNFYASGEAAAKFNLVNIINELILIVWPELNSHGIELKFAHECGKCELKSVASYVRQIFLSLLSNAKDALVESGCETPQILIELKRAGELFCVSVIDNGGGVKADSDEIFEPFFTTKNMGTGTGLNVARELAVKKLGGALELESAANPTKFTLFLGEI